jgi:hypothetical protein
LTAAPGATINGVGSANLGNGYLGMGQSSK